MPVELYDATLRDGMQGAGLSLTAEEKLRVVHKLDELGIGIIEAGFPASNPKEEELFALLEGEQLTSVIAAFGMTRRRDGAAATDPGLRVLAASFAPVCTIVGKTWGLHLEKVVRVGREENLAMIADSVAYLAAEGKRVVYDAEHFFDAFRDDRAYALACVRAAVEAGAERVALCDTNGSSLPEDVTDGVAAAVAEVGGERIGIHCHDDAGCGVANTLAAVRAGATQVQGTMNGVGERTGNANLVTVIANLQLKLGHEVLPDLSRLAETAHFVDELLNRAPDPRAPYVGKFAFTHKGGLHAAGVLADPATFEHVDPALVGNHGAVLVSEQTGRHAIDDRARQVGVEVDTARVLERVKALEHRGYQFEAADASFELLLCREAGVCEELFTLESWRVIVEQHGENDVTTEAVIKIRVGDKRIVRHAEGNGPVNALDTALRRAIAEHHPHLADIKLVNYKARILDETKGTDAVTRVLIDSEDHATGEVWGTIGVHANVIAASWEALVDSLVYAERPAPVRA